MYQDMYQQEVKGRKLSPLAGRLTLVTDEVYAKLSFENAPQGVFTVAKKRAEAEKSYGARAFALFLDTLGDPGNLGTVIRSAEAFGADTVFVGEGSADVYNPKTVRAAMGALFRLPMVITEDIPTAIADLRTYGYDVRAAALTDTAQPLGAYTVTPKTVFVIGNEGHGLSEQTIAACCGSVIIPMAEGAESFNAAIAASILMWERTRI